MFGRIRGDVLGVLRLLVVGDLQAQPVRPGGERPGARPRRRRRGTRVLGDARRRQRPRSSRDRRPDPASVAATSAGCPARTVRVRSAEGGRRDVVHPEAEREPARASPRRAVEDDRVVAGSRGERCRCGHGVPGTDPMYGLWLTGRPRIRSAGSRPCRRRPAARLASAAARRVTTTTPKFATRFVIWIRKTRSGPRETRRDADAAAASPDSGIA